MFAGLQSDTIPDPKTAATRASSPGLVKVRPSLFLDLPTSCKNKKYLQMVFDFKDQKTSCNGWVLKVQAHLQTQLQPKKHCATT